MSVKIPYALEKNTNQLMYIKDVANGLNCNCYCPDCGESLTAKNGGNEDKRSYHFSHGTNSKCTSPETYLHFLAKMVFSNLNSFFLPTGNFYIEENDYLGFPFIENQSYFGKKYQIINTIVEKNININNSIIRPDIKIILNIEGQQIPFLIEIAVNHFIDKTKAEYITKNNLNCIEINLNDLKDNMKLWDENFIKSELFNSDRIKWINQTHYTTLLSQYFEKHQKDLISSIKKIEHIFKNKKIILSGNSSAYCPKSFSEKIDQQYPNKYCTHAKSTFDIKKSLYFFKYNHPIIYLECEEKNKLCIIFSNNKKLIKILNGQQIDVLYLKLKALKDVPTLYNLINDIEIQSNFFIHDDLSKKPYVHDEKQRLIFESFPYSRYDIEKNKFLNNWIGKNINIKEFLKMKVSYPDTHFFVEQENAQNFFIQKIIYDKWIELVNENNDAIIILFNEKIKDLKNYFGKYKQVSIYLEKDFSLHKLENQLKTLYHPSDILKSQFKESLSSVNKNYVFHTICMENYLKQKSANNYCIVTQKDIDKFIV